MSKAGGEVAAKSGISNTKVAKLLPRGWSEISRLWRGFWRHADEDGGHYIWRGQVDGAGRPVFTGYGLSGTHEARELALVYHRGEYQGSASRGTWRNPRSLRPGERLEPSCRQKLCIRPEHQEVLRGDT